MNQWGTSNTTYEYLIRILRDLNPRCLSYFITVKSCFRNRLQTRMTYSDAGVDIDSGNSLVQAIKPLAKSTTRPGCDAMLGGFGALFDLKAAGFIDPVLVSGTDGVGTKLKVGHT